MMIDITSILIGITVILCFGYINKYDNAWDRRFCLKNGKITLLVAVITLQSLLIHIIICACPGEPTAILLVRILLSFFAGALLFGCITDLLCTKVYRFTWWLAWGSGLVMIAIQISIDNMRASNLLSLIVFAVLQECLFSKMYGRADCHAFLACAMAEAAFGMGLGEFLVHMLFSFAILTVVQAIRKNINSNGNLKCPVPFLPYISVGFWGLMLTDTFVPCI